MIRRHVPFAFFLFAAFVAVPSLSFADVTINYGVDEGGILYIDLQAEQANQAVQIFGTGIVADGGADGFELDVQVGDGGPVAGGTDTSPMITSMELNSGTIWEPSFLARTDVIDEPLLKQSLVETSSLVSVDGLLATIVFDTTGFGVGEIEFRLSNVGGQLNTKFFQGTSELTTIAPNGVIRIVTAVPEPSSAIIVVGGLFGIALRRRRKA